MLFTGFNDFNWQVDNFANSYNDTAFGLNSPGHANANTKGANTSMLNGIAEDCYGIAICFTGGNTSAAARRNLVDLLIDPAAGVGNAGTTWSVLIANLLVNSAAIHQGGYWYYFPLFLKKGTAIGTANQSLTATTSALRVGIKVFGKPSRPELIKFGTKVQTLGADTATTSGAAVTPGTTNMGAYSATLGTLTRNSFWWQAGLAFNDTTLGAEGSFIDVAAGDATNKKICADHIPYTCTSTEQTGKGAFGLCNYRDIAAGQDVYVRVAGQLAPQTTPTVTVYALG